MQEIHFKIRVENGGSDLKTPQSLVNGSSF